MPTSLMDQQSLSIDDPEMKSPADRSAGFAAKDWDDVAGSRMLPYQ